MSSDEEVSSGEIDAEVTIFTCKICGDNKPFTAAEKDAHKLWHKAEKEKNASRRTRTRGRESQDRSEVVFEEVSSPAPKRGKKSAPKKRKKSAPKKRKSVKTYDSGVVPRKYDGA